MNQGPTAQILYCPGCGQQYAPGVDNCPHDGTPLVPAPPSMKMMETMAEGTAPARPVQPSFIDAPTVVETAGQGLLPPETASTVIDPEAVMAAPATADDMVGQTMGRYHIEGVLDEGRRGWLLRARPVAGGEPVALKYFYPALAAHKEGKP